MAVNAQLAAEDNRGIIARMDADIVRTAQKEIARQKEFVQMREKYEKAVEQSRYDMVEERLAKYMGGIALKWSQYSTEEKIIAFLHFPLLEDRHSAIQLAHHKTLAWLFGTSDARNEPTNIDETTNFANWLRSDEKMFWISGRPGSGKSTLMKFIAKQRMTTEYLRTWAKGDLLIAEYFFWEAAKNDLQKSQEGLLRSLLYQILRKRPDYIRLVFSDAWHAIHIHSSESDVPSPANMVADTTMPSDVRGLLDALRCTCALLAQSEQRLCFFIDGLDEYDGKPEDIIELIGILRTINNVKLCVSSREWNQFEQAYGSNQLSKLYMQDFNAEDIHAYIHEILGNNDDYKEMKDIDDKERNSGALIQEIVTAANGVFLWVVLVVRSLVKMLQDGQSMADLRAELRRLPTDLEGYFDRILFQDIEADYRQQGAQIFLVALAAKEMLPLISHWYLKEDTLPTERRALTVQTFRIVQKRTQQRLRACCEGLLEPHLQKPRAEDEHIPSASLFEKKVDFLHRTVRDYLRGPKADIQNWMSDDFDPHEAICRAMYSLIKTAPPGPDYSPHVSIDTLPDIRFQCRGPEKIE